PPNLLAAYQSFHHGLAGARGGGVRLGTGRSAVPFGGSLSGIASISLMLLCHLPSACWVIVIRRPGKAAPSRVMYRTSAVPASCTVALTTVVPSSGYSGHLMV